MENNNLCIRLFNFASNVIRFTKSLAQTPGNRVIVHQLIKSGSSSGANYEESQAGSSKADFTNKVLISLREMRESYYWLRLIQSTQDLQPDKAMQLKLLIKESAELIKILGAIVQRSRRKNQKK